MPGNTYNYTTSNVKTKNIGQAIDDMVRAARNTRKGHERRWYDNNFFDDGYHFRYVSRQENKIIDLQERATVNNPIRTIPKASRQIRGVSNLLVSNDLVPVIYPEKIISENYDDPKMYRSAQQLAANVARRTGHWITEEFKSQEIKEKLMFMLILAAKHGISFMQVWPDAVEERIRTQVFDAFDVYVLGNYTEIEDLPFIIKAAPKTVAEIKANEMFDAKQLDQIHPDNRQASSEIKQAYMQARYGSRNQADQSATLIEKEAFVKEYLDDKNMEMIKKQDNAGDILKNRKKYDPVIRHTFSAGGVWLYDEYLPNKSYPMVDFRYEPGNLYQVPMIERFMPMNKSLDMITSRIEKYAHTMGVGVWLKRQGEQFNIANVAGGQVIEYKSVPPRQMNLSEIPSFFFNYLASLNSYIEEQGVSTTTLGKVPTGVKAAKAIESLKESEFANLTTANRMFQRTIRRIAQKFLNIADDYFVQPQTVFFMEKGEPNYFDIIGKSAIKKRDQVGLETGEDIIPLSKEYRVDIEIEKGLGYTQEGKKAAAKDLGDYMVQLSQVGVISPQVVQVFLQKLLEIYNFGPTNEIMDEVKANMGQGNFTDQQIQAIQVAIAKVMKDLDMAGPKADQKAVEATKVGVVQALKDTGMLQKQQEDDKTIETAKAIQEMKIKEEQHKQDMGQKQDKMRLDREKAAQNLEIKATKAKADLLLKGMKAERDTNEKK